MARPSLVIPALNPEQALVDLVRDLIDRGFEHIVVIDDGSSERCRAVFDAVAESPGVEVVRHAENLGKGSALKTAVRHFLDNHPDVTGIVTLDADGQHLPEDVEAVALAMIETPDELEYVLGVRTFEGKVPLRSRFGNSLTKLLFRLFTGTPVRDTQTGLRGIPMDHADELLNIPFARYDFEFEALLRAARARRIVQVPIQTVYLDENAASHFRPVVDSLRIYLIFLRFSVTFIRFSVVGALSFVIDLALFWLLHRFGASIPIAVIGARITSGVFNFTANKLGVFGSRGWRHVPRELAGYLALFVVVMGLSAVGTTLVVHRLSMPPVPGKIAVDVVLFVLAFTVQRRWIFRAKRAPVPGH